VGNDIRPNERVTTGAVHDPSIVGVASLDEKVRWMLMLRFALPFWSRKGLRPLSSSAPEARMEIWMIRIALYALAALLLASASQSAKAASFDCAKAKSPGEKVICTDQEMNDQDVEMSVTYNLLKRLVTMGARGDLETSQTAWLRRREACGADRACLSKAYADRLLQLRTSFEELVKRGPF
jgi:uncharacterized protein YecT (DUF1311 family)